MRALTYTKPLEGEVIAPTDQVTVVLNLSIFSSKQKTTTVPAGSTVEECVLAAETAWEGSRANQYVAYLGGEVVPKHLWGRVRVKKGCFVSIQGLPGKDDNTMRTLLMVAVAIAAIAATFALGPAGFALVSATAASLIGTAILIGGTLLINTLIPIRPPVLGTDAAAEQSQTYSISGGQNQADPWGPIPFVLGTHRFFPLLGARTFSEFVNNKQFLYELFVWGYGPVNVDTFKIGETALASYENYNIEHDFSYDSVTEELTLFPSEVIEDQLNVQLEPKNPEVVWVERTTADNADIIGVDIIYPSGLFKVKESSGKRVEHDSKVKIQYRLVGTTAWKSFDTEIDFSSKKPKALRFTLKQNVTRGQYDVRVGNGKSEYDGPDTATEDVFWSGLRAYRLDPPIEFDEILAVTALSIKATGQLSGSVDAFNGIVHSLQKSYDGVSSWVDNQESSNPADLYRYALQGPFNARIVADSQLDLTKIEEFWTWCDDNGFTFNMVRDFRSSVWELVSDICAAGRGFPTFVDGKWSVAWDDAAAPIVGHFTPRNSRSFTEDRQYLRLPHAFRVRFVNAAAAYKEDERIVYDDGYDINNATRFEQIQFPGITDADLAWRHARYHIAQLRLRPSNYSLTVAREHFRNTVGDRVRVQHYLPLWGLVSGRVKGFADPVVTLDEFVTMETGKNYSVRFTQQGTGTTFVRTVTLVPGSDKEITLSDSGTSPAEGDLFSFGETGLETVVLRIKKIDYLDADEAKITFQDDAPEIATADTGMIPAFNSQITIPPDPLILKPTLHVVEYEATLGEVLATGAKVSWELPLTSSNTTYKSLVPTGARIHYKLSSEDEWTDAGFIVPPDFSVDILDLTAGLWDFRAKTIFNDGTESSWTIITDFNISGVEGVPDDVVNLVGAVNTDFIRLTWDRVITAGHTAIDHYTVRYSKDVTASAAWEAAQIAVDNLKDTNVFLPTLVGTYLVKAVNSAGVESSNAAKFVNLVEGLRGLNAIVTEQEDPSWLGERTETEINAGNLRLAQVGGVMDWPAILSITEEYWTSVFPEVGYFYPTFTDLGEKFTSRVTASISASGENISNLIGSWPEIGTLDAIGGANAGEWSVKYEERHLADTAWIDPSGDTIIGDMTGGGGLAAAFDGSYSQTAANSASKASATSAYIGRTLATSAAIVHAIWWGSSDAGITTAASGTLTLYGKNGTAPASATDGTVIGTASFTDRDDDTPFLIVSTDPDTVWDHVWVVCTVGSSSSIYCGELDLYEATADGWTDWMEIRAAQDYTFRFFDRRLVLDSTANNVRPVVTEASIIIDMPDTFRAGFSISISSNPTSITFSPAFRIYAGMGITPVVQDTGTRFIVSNESETGFDITALDSGDSFVSGQSFSYNAKGAGAVVA